MALMRSKMGVKRIRSIVSDDEDENLDTSNAAGGLRGRDVHGDAERCDSKEPNICKRQPGGFLFIFSYCLRHRDFDTSKTAAIQRKSSNPTDPWLQQFTFPIQLALQDAEFGHFCLRRNLFIYAHV